MLNTDRGMVPLESVGTVHADSLLFAPPSVGGIGTEEVTALIVEKDGGIYAGMAAGFAAWTAYALSGHEYTIVQGFLFPLIPGVVGLLMDIDTEVDLTTYSNKTKMEIIERYFLENHQPDWQPGKPGK